MVASRTNDKKICSIGEKEEFKKQFEEFSATVCRVIVFDNPNYPA